MKEIRLGQVATLDITADWKAVAGSLVLWVLIGAIGTLWLGLTPFAAILGGLLATILHWLSEIWHNLGHARAAENSGHPMTGIYLGEGLLLGRSLYPPDEPPLPAEVHIKRALGGPTNSLLLAMIAFAVTLIVGPNGGVAWWVALFVFFENLFVFCLGAFLPLGFTDGSTILKWRRKRRQESRE